MSVVLTNVFSQYDCPKCGVKFGNETTTVLDTVSKIEESYEIKTITKKKRNLGWKKKSKPTGEGTLKISLHAPINIIEDMYGLTRTGYKNNAIVYGQDSKHGTFLFTALVEDEDGNKMLKAYPNCQVTSGYATSFEANGDEVSEIELEIELSPDSDNNPLYGLYITEDEKQSVDTWISSFSTSMVKTA